MKALVERLFDDHSIGCIGFKERDRSDYYECPCCFYKEFVSMANNTTHITAVKHSPSCSLFKLYQMTLEV